MNLYKILFDHSGPKDSEQGIKCLLLASSDEEVYEWIKNNEDKAGSNSWADMETDEYEIEEFKDNYGDEYPDFKSRIIDLGGEMYDPDYNFDDAYYGITLIGWELQAENVDENSLLIPALQGIIYKS